MFAPRCCQLLILNETILHLLRSLSMVMQRYITWNKILLKRQPDREQDILPRTTIERMTTFLPELANASSLCFPSGFIDQRVHINSECLDILPDQDRRHWVDIIRVACAQLPGLRAGLICSPQQLTSDTREICICQVHLTHRLVRDHLACRKEEGPYR